MLILIRHNLKRVFNSSTIGVPTIQRGNEVIKFFLRAIEMNEKESILSFLALPSEFGLILLIVALTLLLAPYFSGADFGRFKIPNFPPKTRRSLRVIGPLFLIVTVILYLPIISLAQSGSFQNFESNNGTPGSDSIDNYCRSIWFTRCEFTSETAHTGKRSILVKVEKHQQPDQNSGTVPIFPSSVTPLDLSKAKVSSAWVYDTQGIVK